MTVVRLTAAHIPALAALEAQCFSKPWSANGIAAELENAAARFLVAETNGEVVGYIGVHEVAGEGYIANLAVHEQHRRRGVASALLRAAEEGALNRGVAILTLEVRASNFAAIALYTRNGYAVVGHRPRFYSAPTEDAVLMTKVLTEETL